MIDYETDCPYCGEESLGMHDPRECRIDQAEAIAEALAETSSCTSEIYEIMAYADAEYPENRCR